MKDKKEIIADRAEKIQSEMHSIINELVSTNKNTKAQHNDFVTAYLIRMIASLQIELESLTNNINYN